MHTLQKTLLTSALSLLCTTTIAQQKVVRPAPVNLWMDVSTSSFAGMPNMESMGAGGSLFGGLVGAASGNASLGGVLKTYGQSRTFSISSSIGKA